MSTSRQWLSAAARQCRSALTTQQRTQLAQQPPLSRALSTTPSLSAFRDSQNNTYSNTNTNRLAGSTPTTFTNPNAALQDLASSGLNRSGPLTPEERRRVIEEQVGTSGHIRDLAINTTTDNYLRQNQRRWRVGDVYTPRDIGKAEMKKWGKMRAPLEDVVEVLGFNPVDNYKNFSLISDFMTPMGRIKHSSETGLRPVNQRKMAKAIRRAIGMGLHPSVHRHPEILRIKQRGISAMVPIAPTENRL
ncbi:ribosomal protein S18 [Dichotomopilus funicola]|uniref:Small ribosomal subunit protein bS18m n=1 Tax=Dichotomopilus funicola TaxID=1934379 RepID=A0AAN6ZNH5_9PEZI|nr:ribosomal protein S18 [Dichotomopilus funicola]